MTIIDLEDEISRFFQCDCEGECEGHEMTDEDNEEFKRIVREAFQEFDEEEG